MRLATIEKKLDKINCSLKGKHFRKCVECGEVSDKGVEIQRANRSTDFLCEKCFPLEVKRES